MECIFCFFFVEERSCIFIFVCLIKGILVLLVVIKLNFMLIYFDIFFIVVFERFFYNMLFVIINILEISVLKSIYFIII